MSLVEKDLNAEQIVARTHQLEGLKREVDEYSVEIERGIKLLELKIPERQIRGQINSLRDKINMNERNIKVLEVQIRNRKEKVFSEVDNKS